MEVAHWWCRTASWTRRMTSHIDAFHAHGISNVYPQGDHNIWTTLAWVSSNAHAGALRNSSQHANTLELCYVD